MTRLDLDVANELRFGTYRRSAHACETSFDARNNGYKEGLSDAQAEEALRPKGSRFVQPTVRGMSVPFVNSDGYSMRSRTDTVVPVAETTNLRYNTRGACSTPLFNESHVINPEFRGKDADTAVRPAPSTCMRNGHNLYYEPWEVLLKHRPKQHGPSTELENELVRGHCLQGDRLSTAPSATEKTARDIGVAGCTPVVEDWIRGGVSTRYDKVAACSY